MSLTIKVLWKRYWVGLLICFATTGTSTGQSPQTPPEHTVKEPLHTNRLIDETSPYLLQHAHNPVDWYPWGPAAFAKAQAENKPIFLSVGYSTCYWCHVMERESFEQEDVAEILNEHFVSIKVDREEHPELDQQFMLATQLIVGRGGWPNSVWLTADGRPWMAGTYFPRPQFKSALLQLADAWRTRQEEIQQQATTLTSSIERIGAAKFEPRPISQALLDQAVASAVKHYDPLHGGFSAAPKFPPHAQLGLLIDQYRRHADPQLLDIVDNTLMRMSHGGVFDQIGGGFHRYSTDDQWLLPHFEKMLYDNAQVLKPYTDCYLLNGNQTHRETVERIFVWLQREMTAPSGAFYSAIDSESNAQEGKYYVWSYGELLQVLGSSAGKQFAEVYGALPEGNFKEEASGHRTGDNVLFVRKPIDDYARESGLDPDRLKQQLGLHREQLLVRRSERVAPICDDKIIAAWNGLAIEGLAYAGRQLERPEYIDAARRAADFILQEMVIEGQLQRTYRAGKVKFPATLDDYAFVAAAMLELFRATQDPKYLEAASQFAEIVLADFDDPAGGGFYFTGDDSASEDAGLLIRAKNLTDGGNLPSGNGVMTQVLFDLATLTDTPRYAVAAERNLAGLSGYLARAASGADRLLLAAATHLDRAPSAPSESKPETSIANFAATAISGRVYTSHEKLIPGQSFQLSVRCTIDPGWHLYASNPDVEFVQPTTLELIQRGGFELLDINTPAGRRLHDEVIDQELEIYSGEVSFELKLRVPREATPGVRKVQLILRSQACDSRQCAAAEQTEIELQLAIELASNTAPPRSLPDQSSKLDK